MNQKKIILGTTQFGLDYGINNEFGMPSQEKVFEILIYAQNHGINFVDTADAYGNASKIIGKFNARFPGKFLINSKFIWDGVPLPLQIAGSLAKLKINHLNVYFYHRYNDFIKFPSLQKELEILKKDGKITKIGLSVYNNDELKSAINSEIIDVIQFPFNLLDNRSKRGNLMKYGKDKGKELQVRSVFLQGLFFKTLNDIPTKLAPLIPYLFKINKLSKQSGISIETLALSYAIQQPEIDHVIIGVDNLAHLKKNLEIVGFNLHSDILDTINKIVVHETELLYPKNWN
ncbi:MAG: aldo/keto reductase [Bacteroidales bacterium]|nr:aldo/keto reductase [Bacteroidales bacterium]